MTVGHRRLVLVAVGLFGLSATALHAADVLPSFAPAIQRVEGAAVRIVTPASADEGGDPSAVQDAIRRFSFDPGDGSRLLGTGVIISADGEIVTSRHVVDGVSRVRVRLSTDEEVPATVIGGDESSDLALLRINVTTPLVPVSLADEPTIAVGDWVVALGNGAGPMPAAAAGILGSKGRVLGLGNGPDLLQLDMTILPVGSGAPLVDARGAFVGVAVAQADPVGGVAGVSFGVPVELVRWFVQQIHEHGHVVRGWLGLTVQPVTPDLAAALRLPAAEGALVAEVASGSPAAKAGVKRGDVVTSIGERTIRRARELPGLVAGLTPGTTVTLTLERNGKERTLEATLREEPATTTPTPANTARRGVEGDWGFAVRPATAQEVKQMGLEGKTGVVVTAIDEESAAEDGGLEAEDMIVTANREPVHSVAELRRALGTNAGHALLLVRRGTASLYVELDR